MLYNKFVQKKRNIFLILAILFLLAFLLFNKFNNYKPSFPQNPKIFPTDVPLEDPQAEKPSNEEPVICTMEAKECPDGSFVGRKGPKCEFTRCPETIDSNKQGWKTYKNYSLGFEISFPEKFKIVEDKYGWPNSVVLIYGGGQSYDLPVEQWSDASEYQSKYQNQTNLTVKKVGNTYITLLNTNLDSEVDQIITTFKQLP